MAKVATVSAFQIASRKPAGNLTINAEPSATVAVTLFPADHVRGIKLVKTGLVFQLVQTNARQATINVRDLRAEPAEFLGEVALPGELIRHAIQNATAAGTACANAVKPNRLARKIAATIRRQYI